MILMTMTNILSLRHFITGDETRRLMIYTTVIISAGSSGVWLSMLQCTWRWWIFLPLGGNDWCFMTYEMVAAPRMTRIRGQIWLLSTRHNWLVPTDDNRLHRVDDADMLQTTTGSVWLCLFRGLRASSDTFLEEMRSGLRTSLQWLWPFPAMLWAGGVSGMCLLFASWLNADVVAMIFLRHNGNDWPLWTILLRLKEVSTCFERTIYSRDAITTQWLWLITWEWYALFDHRYDAMDWYDDDASDMYWWCLLLCLAMYCQMLFYDDMQQLDYPEQRICFGCDDSCYTAWLCIASGLQRQLLAIAWCAVLSALIMDQHWC